MKTEGRQGMNIIFEAEELACARGTGAGRSRQVCGISKGPCDSSMENRTRGLH